MRNLATIQKIKSLDAIEGKDRIKLASFESTGWHVIVDLTFKVGDLCVYCEYDSLLPEGNPAFEFLRKRCYKPLFKGFLISAMKMSGVVSEGIVFPLSILPSVKSEKDWKEGNDVTDLLGITKYNPELKEENENISPNKRSKLFKYLLRYKFIKRLLIPENKSGSYPSWAYKSDESRIQALGNSFLQDNIGKLFYVTEKMDGTSTLYAIKKGKFFTCSRNYNYPKPGVKSKKNYYWEYALSNNIEKTLKSLRKFVGFDFYIQGELCGPGIQKNKYKFEQLNFFAYSIYNIDKKRFLNFDEYSNFMKLCPFNSVPFLFGFEIKEDSTVDSLVEMAKGKSYYNQDQDREGLIFRSVECEHGIGKMGPVFGFKVINPDFLVLRTNNER